MSSLKQNLSQKMLQKLSPQQIQFIKLLQLNTQDFEEKLEQELLDNPALEDTKTSDEERFEEPESDDFSEEDYLKDDVDINEFLSAGEDDGGFHLNEDYNNDEPRESPVASQNTFQEYLMEQARATFYDETDLLLAIHLINSIEEDGYLRRELRSIVNDLAFNENIATSEDHLEKLLIKIQNFDPAGIAARDLQECLLLQLYKKDYGDNPAITLAETIINEQMEAFSKKHYDKIKRSLKIDDEQLKSAIQEIVKLNPKPGETGVANTKTQYIVPDFTVKNNEGVLEVSLNSRNAPDLKISAAYSETLKAYDSSPTKAQSLKDAVQYIKQKLDGAKWFIDSVKQRQNTLMSTMEAIVHRQKDFFAEGDETCLRPMILKDIANQVGLDISTISRVANSKYVETDFGIFPLKYFFSEGIVNDDGEEVSNREIKKILSNAIEAEEKKKPLTDEALMELLKEKGYNIARRTVAKYREQLNIPVARLRKEL
jgi:RNA polymerase sigma-54 factor